MKTQRTSNSRVLHWEVILFMALYILLPSYFALELSQSLPLITASRILIALMGVILLIRRRDVFSFKSFRIRNLNLTLTQDPFLRTSLLIYWGLLLLVNATFLFKTTESVKQIFVIIAEEYLVVWMLCLIIDTREKLISALRIMVFSAAAVAVIAAIGSIINYNPFLLLDTVSRDMVIRPFYRYGVLRACVGFMHPVYYGAYCAVMLPIGMFFADRSETKREKLLYSGCLVLILTGLILSNSRGSILAFGCTACLIFFIRLYRKSLGKLFATYLPIIGCAVVILALVFALSPAGRPRLAKYAESVKNFFSSHVEPGPGTDPSTPTDPSTSEPSATEPSEPEPDLTPEFGENPNGVGSRLDQLSGIRYTVERQPVFGFGPNAPARGLVGYMYSPGTWSFVKTVDVNIVAIISQYGLVGLIGFLCLYGSIGISFLRKPYRSDPLMHYLFLAFVCYMLCLLSISFLDKWFWVITGLGLCLINIIRKEQVVSD